MYIPFMITGLAYLLRWIGKDGPKDQPTLAEPDLEQVLQDAELAVLQGDLDACHKKLAAITRALDGKPPSMLEAWHGLLFGELLESSGQSNGAAEYFGPVLKIAGALDGEQRARDLQLCARIGQVTLDLRHFQESALNDARELIARQGETQNAAVWVRLARLAKFLAEVRHERGDWVGARDDYEAAVRIGEQVPEPGKLPEGSFYEPLERSRVLHRIGRATASRAARAIGFTLCTSGDHEAGLAWLDRAVAMLGNLDDPDSRALRAWILSVRGVEDVEDPVLGAPVRRQALERALEEGAASGTSSGLIAACQAALSLAKEHVERGDTRAAEIQLSRADELLNGATGATAWRAMVFLEQGYLFRNSDRFDAALERFRAVDTLGRAQADIEARYLALQGACQAHALLIAGGRLDEARELLAELDARVPTLSPPNRAHSLLLIGQCRAAQCFQDGDRQAAATTLAGVVARISRAKGEMLAPLMRRVIADQGRIALSDDRAPEAIVFFLRALEIGVIGEPPAIEDLFRAGVTLDLARAYVTTNRGADAREALERVFELGRRSGSNDGRAHAAIAALNLGLASEDLEDQRVDWLRAAVRFGQLSGLKRGLEAAHEAEELLKGGFE